MRRIQSQSSLLVGVLALCTGTAIRAQSSSLYVDPAARPQQRYVTINGVADRLSPQIATASIAAVRLPEPRQFAVHDLITIIVRESIENESESEIESEKDVSIQGLISAWPNIQLRDLADLQLGQANLTDGRPQVDLNLSKEFEGEGAYERRDTFTTRITARIIDIKPNGTLVLEARKFIQSDEESVNVVLTGTCRKQDIAANNTLLSTQIYDLRLVKEHTGELRRATKKGLITQFFDLIFNF